MEEIPLLTELLIIILLSTGVILACHSLRLPPIVGLFLTGILSGPHGFALIEKVEQVQSLASIGLVLLLFTIGLEFSFERILTIKKVFFLGGSLQLLFTLTTGAAASALLQRPLGEALFFGCLITLSSTAIVLRLLNQRQETDTPHGRAVISILLFQDLCAVPMLLALPLLGSEQTSVDIKLLWRLAAGLFVLLSVTAAAWLLVPNLLYRVAKTRIRELFLLCLIGICIAVTWTAQQAGMSLSLGAFLAGLIICQSDFSHEAMSDIIPFQDLFTSFFFIAIGMLLDLSFVLSYWWLILPLSFAIILLKCSMAALASLACGFSLRTALLIGLCISQIGEFSLLLVKEGYDFSLAPSFYYQLFLSFAIITMILTPALMQFSHPIAYSISRFITGRKEEAEEIARREGHVVIIGFGLAGRTVAHSCREAQLPYLILDMNASTVQNERLHGEPIYYADATHHSILTHFSVQTAKVVVIAINDSQAMKRIIKNVRRCSASVHMIVRTRYMEEVQTLYAMGADEVIPDEYGAAVELFTRVLAYFSKPVKEIGKLVTQSLLQGFEHLNLSYSPEGLLEDEKRQFHTDPRPG